MTDEEKPILTMLERLGYKNDGDPYDGLKMPETIDDCYSVIEAALRALEGLCANPEAWNGNIARSAWKMGILFHQSTPSHINKLLNAPLRDRADKDSVDA